MLDEELVKILNSGSATDSVIAPSGRLLPPRDMLESNLSAFFSNPLHPALKLLQNQTKGVIDSLYDDREPIRKQSFAIESVIIADGSRPVFFIQDGKIKQGFGNGPFVDRLEQKAPLIEQVARSVGRIESDLRIAEPWMDGVFYMGTAFVVGPNLAITNRHVAQAMINGSIEGAGPFGLNGPWWLNFAGESGDLSKRRVAIVEVLWADTTPVSTDAGLKPFDAALLRLGDPEFESVTTPASLPITSTPPAQGQVVGLVGYPGKPRIITPDEPTKLRCEEESERALIKLFDNRFGAKRCGSGEINALPGFEGDDNDWTIKHDISTLGGNSGSPIFDLSISTEPRVFAAHFGGCSRVENYGALLNRFLGQLQGFGVVVM